MCEVSDEPRYIAMPASLSRISSMAASDASCNQPESITRSFSASKDAGLMPPPGLGYETLEDSTEAGSDESFHAADPWMQYAAAASWAAGWPAWQSQDELAMAMASSYHWGTYGPPTSSFQTPPPGQWDRTPASLTVGSHGPAKVKPPAPVQEAPSSVALPASPPPPPPSMPATATLPKSPKQAPGQSPTLEAGAPPPSSPVLPESNSQLDFSFPALLEDLPTDALGKEMLTVEHIDEHTLAVEWLVKESRLKSMDKQAASPSFEIPLESTGNEKDEDKKPVPSVPFRLMIVPAARNDGRGAGSFKQAKGKGRVSLKCLDPGSNAALPPMSIVVKMEAGGEPARGPIEHDFLEKSCFECPQQANPDNAWNFSAAVDPSRKVFAIRVEVTRRGAETDQE